MFDRSVPAVDDQAAAWGPDLRDDVLRMRADGHTGLTVPLTIRDPRVVLDSWREESTLFYWASRNQAEIIIACGIADQVFVDGALDEQQVIDALREVETRAARGARFYGGLRFDPFVDGSREWSPYGTLNFFRPQFEVRISGDTAVLIVNDPAQIDLDDVMARWRFGETHTNGHDLRVIRRGSHPDRPAWVEGVVETLGQIRAGFFEKAVLARAVDLHGNGEINPVDLLEKIIDTAPSCYHMLFRPVAGTAFVSATPERLLARRRTRLRSEAVAGTRPRSVSLEDDTRLRDELMASDKDRREHEVVGRSIIEALEPFVRQVEIEKHPSEMRLATGRHLKSAIRAELEPGVATADVVAAIHPTPAVGGYPTREAMQRLRDAEPFDRGWYAGAIGWIGHEEAELAVGIRSALVSGPSVRLYSGAGIVEGSDPQSEWDEIEQKIDGFLRVLRIQGQ